MVRSLGGLNCPQQPFTLSSPQHISHGPPNSPHSWWREQHLKLPGKCAPCLALMARKLEYCLYEDKAILQNVTLPTHSNFNLLSTSFIFISQGMHWVLKFSKSLLNFTHFWNKTTLQWAMRAVKRGSAPKQDFLISEFGSMVRYGCKVQSRNSGLGLTFWAISETHLNPKSLHSQEFAFIIWVLRVLTFPGFWKPAVVL